MLVQLVTVFIMIRTGAHDASFRYAVWYCMQYVSTKWNTYMHVPGMVGRVINVQGKTQPINNPRLTKFGSWDYDKGYFEFTPKKVSSILNYQFWYFVNVTLKPSRSMKWLTHCCINTPPSNKSIKPAKTQLYKEMTNLATWRCYVTSLCLQDHLGRLHLEWQSVAMALILIRCWLTHGVDTDMTIWWVYML